MQTIWWIVIIIIAFIILKRVYRYFRPKRHSFWGKQPVSRDSTQKGVISTTRLPAVPPTDPHLHVYHMPIDTTRSRSSLGAFLKSNFIKGYIYTPDFLAWALGNSHRGKDYTFAIRKQSEPLAIIGSISVKDFSVVLDGNRQRMGYVDYLAVHSDYRKQGLAPCLISKVVESTPIDTFLFKIEDTPLPFESTCTFQYYSYFHDMNPPTYQLPSHLKCVHLGEGHLEEALDYLTRRSQGYALYAEYTLDEFRYWFLPRPGVLATYITIDSSTGDVVGLFSYFLFHTEVSFNSTPLAMAEVSLFLAEDASVVGKQLILASYRDRIDCLVCPNIGMNTEFLNELPFIPNKSCHIQLYNYGMGRSLEANEVLLNFA